MNNKQSYGVKHKATGLFFSGFDCKTMLPIWGVQSDAKCFDQDGAHQQALLFVTFGIQAQLKPVKVAQ